MDDVTVMHETESFEDLTNETLRLRLAVPGRRNVRRQRTVGGVAHHHVNGVSRLEHLVQLQLIDRNASSFNRTEPVLRSEF